MHVAIAVAIGGGAPLPPRPQPAQPLFEKARQLAGHSTPTAVFGLAHLSRVHGNTNA